MVFSKYDSNIDEDFLLNTPESLYFDRKSFWLKPKELANDIIWMANASWWLIVVGIKDKKFEKLPSDFSNEKYQNFLQILYDYIYPIPNVKIEEIKGDKYDLILYHIQNDLEQIYQRSDNEKHYLRVWDETKTLTYEQTRCLYHDKGVSHFEAAICHNFSSVDFRKTLTQYYIEKIKFKGTFEDLLVARWLAYREDGKIKYTNWAVLLFSESPDKYIPSSTIRYVRFEWNELKPWDDFNVVKDQIFTGPIPLLIEKLKNFLAFSLEEYYYLDQETGKFDSSLEYPEAAWLEWIVNALTHRSYHRQGNPIMIKHYDDRLEISNSGPLPSIVTIENIKENRYARNPKIARVLYELGYVRELNEGVKRIFSSMQKMLLWEPTYKDENYTVTLTLRNTVKRHTKLFGKESLNRISKHFSNLHPFQKSMVYHLLEYGTAKNVDFQRILSTSAVTVRKYLNPLIELGILEKHQENERDPNAFFTIKKS